jgi:hypothetical protein
MLAKLIFKCCSSLISLRSSEDHSIYVETILTQTITEILKNKYKADNVENIMMEIKNGNSYEWFIDCIYIMETENGDIKAFFFRLCGQKLSVLDITDIFTKRIVAIIRLGKDQIMTDLLNNPAIINMFMNIKLPLKIY